MHPRPRRPREGFVLRLSGSQIDHRCDRRSRSHRPPASSLPGFQSRAVNTGQIMPRARCLINMLLRVVALLFSRGGPLRIDGLAGPPTGPPDTSDRRTARPSSLDPERVCRKTVVRTDGRGISVALSTDDGSKARNDLAWAISVGGIGTVLFAAL